MPSRRTFVVSRHCGRRDAGRSAALLLGRARRTTSSFVAGRLFDGTGKACVEMEIGIADGRVVDIARRLADSGAVEIDKGNWQSVRFIPDEQLLYPQTAEHDPQCCSTLV
jgi:hypothetical protein